MLKKIKMKSKLPFLFIMPVDRARPLKKRKESEALVLRIEHTGFEMFPCSRYDKRNLKYVVSDKENSGRCSECVCHKVAYNIKNLLASSWQALELEEDCLEQESETALCLAEENLAYHKRFERQKKF